MKGKALIKKLHQKKYNPIIWIKDDTNPKGKAQIYNEPCNTREIAEHLISLAESQHECFFTDIKEVIVEIEGEFYIDRGYHS